MVTRVALSQRALATALALWATPAISSASVDADAALRLCIAVTAGAWRPWTGEPTGSRPYERWTGAALRHVPDAIVVPSRGLLIACMLSESGRASEMSRRDALWFQAGYGGSVPASGDGFVLRFAPLDDTLPISGTGDPTIFRVLRGQTPPSGPIPFSFQIGR